MRHFFVQPNFKQRLVLGFTTLMMLFVSAMVVVEVFGIPGTAYQGTQQQLTTRTLGEMQLVSGFVADHISSWVKDRRAEVAEVDALRAAWLKEAQLQATLGVWQGSHPAIESVALIDAVTGQVLLGSGRLREVATRGEAGFSAQQWALSIRPGQIETLALEAAEDHQIRLRITRQLFSAGQTEPPLVLLVTESRLSDAMTPMMQRLGTYFAPDWLCSIIDRNQAQAMPLQALGRQSLPAVSAALPVPPQISTFWLAIEKN